VFDRAWIADHIAGRRTAPQRTAFVRGVVRAAIVSGAITVAMSVLALEAVRSARFAERQRKILPERSSTVSTIFRCRSAKRRAPHRLQGQHAS